MSRRDLVWSDEAIAEVESVLDRRTEKDAVFDCIEGHLLAVANNSSIASLDRGIQDFLLYRFTCRDGDVGLNLQAEFQILDDQRIAVLSCNSIAL